MSNYFYILSASNKPSQVQFYASVPALTDRARGPGAFPMPAASTKANATGQTMEAWAGENPPKDGKVEGGLYKCSLKSSAFGGAQTVYWIIQADARSKADPGDVVGQAVILKSAGSVQNPEPTVVPVMYSGSGDMGASGTVLYYFKSS